MKIFLEKAEIRSRDLQTKEDNRFAKENKKERFSNNRCSSISENMVKFVEQIQIRILSGVGYLPVPNEIINNLTFFHPIENIIDLDKNKVKF